MLGALQDLRETEKGAQVHQGGQRAGVLTILQFTAGKLTLREERKLLDDFKICPPVETLQVDTLRPVEAKEAGQSGAGRLIKMWNR